MKRKQKLSFLLIFFFFEKVKCSKVVLLIIPQCRSLKFQFKLTSIFAIFTLADRLKLNMTSIEIKISIIC